MANLSGLRYKLTVFYAGGEKQELQVAPVDCVVWEKKNGGQSFARNEPTITQILWAAWASGRRKGEIDEREFDQWVRRVEDFDRDDEDEDDGPDPTNPAASETSSPDSL